MKELVKEKIRQAHGILDELGIDCHLTLVRETSAMCDPVLRLIFCGDVVWTSAFMLFRDGTSVAVVGEHDAGMVRELGAYDVVAGYMETMVGCFREQLERKNPRQIAINYDESDAPADGLTHGLYRKLTGSLLAGTPYAERLASASPIIARLIGRKTLREVARIERAIATSEAMLAELTPRLHAGLTTRQVYDMLQAEVRRVGLEFAWSPPACPGVTSGPGMAAGHGGPGDVVIEPGHVLRVDFGVKQDGYCADLQRCWYFLKPGESAAPPEVQRGFDAVLGAVEAAAAALRPGVKGLEVDAVARRAITAAGYPEYMHALGHGLGASAHDGGPLLGPCWDRYGERPHLVVEAGNVFTIEPGVETPGGVIYLEEDVLVTSEGCRYLSRPQTALTRVGPR